jgi:hypothetical protein
VSCKQKNVSNAEIHYATAQARRSREGQSFPGSASGFPQHKMRLVFVLDLRLSALDLFDKRAKGKLGRSLGEKRIVLREGWV